tara:strand:+ start:477 stop:908 length:432 start_codon:yes stop_codon:yes gene_type:complete
MFEELHELLKASSVSRLSIGLESITDVRVAVTIQAILGQEPADVTDEQRRLRGALSMPLRIEGHAGEVDANIERLVDDYVSTVRPKADLLTTNIDTVKEGACTETGVGSKSKNGDGREATSADAVAPSDLDDVADINVDADSL